MLSGLRLQIPHIKMIYSPSNQTKVKCQKIEIHEYHCNLTFLERTYISFISYSIGNSIKAACLRCQSFSQSFVPKTSFMYMFLTFRVGKCTRRSLRLIQKNYKKTKLTKKNLNPKKPYKIKITYRNQNHRIYARFKSLSNF